MAVCGCHSDLLSCHLGDFLSSDVCLLEHLLLDLLHFGGALPLGGFSGLLFNPGVLKFYSDVIRRVCVCCNEYR